MNEHDGVKYFMHMLEDTGNSIGTVEFFTKEQIIEIKRFLINKGCLIKSVYIYVYNHKPYWIDFYGDLVFIEEASIGFVLQALKQKNIFENN